MANFTKEEINDHPKSWSISDDDLCATCTMLCYQPGELSLCSEQLNHDELIHIRNEGSDVESCPYYDQMPF